MIRPVHTEIISDTGTKLGVENHEDGSVFVYMTKTTWDTFDLLVDEFEPVDLIALSKVLIEAAQNQIENRNVSNE